jgi:hypothetical protein
MHLHLAKIMAEARLEESPRDRIKRLARRPQYFVHNRWHFCVTVHPSPASAERCALQNLFLFAALSAHSATDPVSAARALALEHRARNRGGGCIRFSLKH